MTEPVVAIDIVATDLMYPKCGRLAEARNNKSNPRIL